MHCAYSDTYTIDLPPGHRFPMAKYRRTREQLVSEGNLVPSELLAPAPCSTEDLRRVHTQEYVDKIFAGTLTKKEERRLGFPWSPSLLRRSRASVAGTIYAAGQALDDGIAGNLAGGTHHAYADHGEGFCVFNDIAVAIRHLQAAGAIRTAAVVDCDVHQGNGTAHIFCDDPTVFTLSLHGENNWPFDKETSSLDVALADGAGDDEYLVALDSSLEHVGDFYPELVFYIAGVDPFEHDQLGRLALTIEGLRERDRRVFSWARRRALPVAICLGGGYAENINDIVEAHANTYRAAAEIFGHDT